VEAGQTAPDFELTTLDGKSIRLSELRGKGVLINFWASWCKP
jgi:peroxiredoxin